MATFNLIIQIIKAIFELAPEAMDLFQKAMALFHPTSAAPDAPVSVATVKAAARAMSLSPDVPAELNNRLAGILDAYEQAEALGLPSQAFTNA